MEKYIQRGSKITHQIHTKQIIPISPVQIATQCSDCFDKSYMKQTQKHAELRVHIKYLKLKQFPQLAGYITFNI